MTDLLRILPSFPIGQYASFVPALEKHQVTVSDLLTLDITDLGKRTQLPLLDLKRLSNAVLEALHTDLGVFGKQSTYDVNKEGGEDARQEENQGSQGPPSLPRGHLKHTPATLQTKWSTISTLDDSLDRALGGGVPAGRITEITGESGAGKTQFLLSLLLAVQLPPPHGTSRPALYISTEAPLSTRRLSQMLNANPLFKSTTTRPTLDNIISTATPDLESQDHILTFQVPVEVARRNIGLIVLDSVAANYRAEFERQSGGARGSNMAARGAELVRLGMLLHDLAVKHNLAVVVANQVADRFTTTAPTPSSGLHRHAVPGSSFSQSSPLATRSKAPPAEPTSSLAEMALPRSSAPAPPPPQYEDAAPPQPAALLLDHQQRWFTGWGDDPAGQASLKTPSLGLVWSTQVAMRIALIKKAAYGPSRYEHDAEGDGGERTLRAWRRWMKVVFAPHVAGTGQGLEGAVEFEVNMGGLTSRVVGEEKRAGKK